MPPYISLLLPHTAIGRSPHFCIRLVRRYVVAGLVYLSLMTVGCEQPVPLSTVADSVRLSDRSELLDQPTIARKRSDLLILNLVIRPRLQQPAERPLAPIEKWRLQTGIWASRAKMWNTNSLTRAPFFQLSPDVTPASVVRLPLDPPIHFPARRFAVAGSESEGMWVQESDVLLKADSDAGEVLLIAKLGVPAKPGQYHFVVSGIPYGAVENEDAPVPEVCIIFERPFIVQ